MLERFLPDLSEGISTAYTYQFLGKSAVSRKITSTNPIVKAGSSTTITLVEPHQTAKNWCKQFKLDYGKIDYVIHNGEVVVLDLNKTIGDHPAFIYKTGMSEEEIIGDRVRAINDFFHQSAG